MQQIISTALNKEFYGQNREQLAKLCPCSIIVVSGNMLMQRTGDTSFPFRQDSNLLYLTGINEPECSLVIDTRNNYEFIMVNKKNGTTKIFDGDIDTEEIAAISGVNNYVSYQQGVAYIANQKQTVLINSPIKFRKITAAPNPYRSKLMQSLARKNVKLQDIRPTIAKLRVIKKQPEVNSIKIAVSITKQAIQNAEQLIDSVKNESELAANINTSFAEAGVVHAYDPIIAAGKNATTLHYIRNNQNITPGDALLFDVGAEVQGYAADISRTFVIGENKRADDIITAVKSVQSELISYIKPGVTWKRLSEIANKLVFIELKKLKITKDKNDIHKYFPHAFGHYLGLDVHDVGDYTMPLEKNMVITVEPGIYIPEEGIGVRIEDDILVTKIAAKML